MHRLSHDKNSALRVRPQVRAQVSARTSRFALVAPAIFAAASLLAVSAPAGASASSTEQDAMIVYRPGEKVPASELVDLGDPASLGATVLDGDPKISARIDFASGNVLAGVFQATRGKVRIHFPFTEHATILSGDVELSDEWGNHARLEPGDSYLIRQGSVILWEVRGQALQKTFFNRTDETTSPGPMVVYKARDEVPQSQLAELGAPEQLGGTVLSGNPEISGRVDYAEATATGGLFQATRGDVQIDFPFTEHATVIEGAVTLTDELGRAHRLRSGDSYLIRKGSSIFWHVAKSRVQKSFFNVRDE